MDRARITSPLCILQTFVCSRPPCYEIQLAADPDARPLVLRTANPTLYHRALRLEGEPDRVIASWHIVDGINLLDGLEVMR